MKKCVGHSLKLLGIV